MAYSTYLSTVQKVYIAFFQRPADSEGLRYWAERLDAAGGDLTAIIEAYANAPETTQLYGEINASTIATVIGKIYQGLFGRDPDAEGLEFYTKGFTEGRFTPGAIALDILNGAKNEDNAIIANKVKVANTFTEGVDGHLMTDPAFGKGEYAATYSGKDDAQAARDMLAGVTEDASTVLDANAVTTLIKDKIADKGDPILGDEPISLTEALANLEAAKTEEAAKLDAVDTFVHKHDSGAGKIDSATKVTAAVNTAEGDKAEALSELTKARADKFTDGNFKGLPKTDARLEQILSDAQKALDAALAKEESDAFKAKQALDAAENNLSADIKADGDNARLLSDLKAELETAYNYGISKDDIFAGTQKVGDLIAEIVAAKKPESIAKLIEDIAKMNLDAKLSGIIPVKEAFGDIKERQDFINNVAGAQDKYDKVSEVAAVLGAQNDVDIRQGLKDDVTHAQDYLHDLEALADAFASAATGHSAAQKVLTDLGYKQPVFLSHEHGGAGTAGNDIFMISSLAGKEITTVGDFGKEGRDKLFLGKGYSLVGLGDKNITDKVGDANALEVFWKAEGNDLKLFIETEAFAGNSTGTNEIITITLTGVASKDIALDGEFISAGIFSA
ncbi:hypothetical protein MASR1M90_16220 [Desulfovibrionales bacterium]